MTDAAKQLLNQVLALPSEVREWVVAELLASLDGPGDAGWAAAWAAELTRRREAAESRGEPGADWAGVRARILTRLRKT